MNCWQWFLLAAVGPLLQFACLDSRVEQRQRVCFMLCWLTCPWQLLQEEQHPWGLSILLLFISVLRHRFSSFTSCANLRPPCMPWAHPKQSLDSSARDKSPVRWGLCWPTPVPWARSREIGPVCWQEVWGVKTAMAKLAQPHKSYIKCTQEVKAASPAPNQELWPREVVLIKHVQTSRKHCKNGK